VRQFGKKAKGPVQRRRRRSVGQARTLACYRLFAFVNGHQSKFQQAAVGKLSQQCRYVGKHTVARRRIDLHEIVHDSSNGGLPVTAFHDIGGNSIGLEDALGRK
jgi:hypothetical protein